MAVSEQTAEDSGNPTMAGGGTANLGPQGPRNERSQGWGWGSVVDPLPYMHEFLGLIQSKMRDAGGAEAEEPGSEH